jgi:hypothetical protein
MRLFRVSIAGCVLGYCVVLWIAFLIVTTIGMFLLPADLGQ